MPCAPNPTTGFFFFLPKSKVIELPISVEDATKLVISAGLIQPEIKTVLEAPLVE